MLGLSAYSLGLPRLLRAQSLEHDFRVLVLFEQLGGCDPVLFSTPSSSTRYDALRVRRNNIHLFDRDNLFRPFNGVSTGMAPGFSVLESHKDKLALIQNCINYKPSSSRSHEKAQNFMTFGGSPSATESTGWLGRLYGNSSNLELIGLGGSRAKNFHCNDEPCSTEPPLVTANFEGFNLDGSSFNSLLGGTNNTKHVAETLEQLLRQKSDQTAPVIKRRYEDSVASMFDAVSEVEETLGYQSPKYNEYVTGADRGLEGSAMGRYNSLAQRFRNVASKVKQLKDTGSSERIVFVIGHGSYDIHGKWQSRIDQLAYEVAEILKVFFDDADAMGCTENVLFSTSTDFGRQLLSNGSGAQNGTDHGDGFTSLVMGGGVNSGLYGDSLSVSQIQTMNSWPKDYDSRALYAELVKWLGFDPYASSFSGDLANFDALPFNLFPGASAI
jgi:uncharacterized protein (DUF1501 family)